MSKQTISGFITHTSYPWALDEAYYAFSMAESIGEYTVTVRPHSFEAEVPDNFNPNPLKVKALQAKIEKVQSAALAEVRKMQEEIQDLLCLSFEAPAADTVFENPPQDIIDLHTAEGSLDV